MGCVNSTIDKPPTVRSPAKRAANSNIAVLTELSDLSDEFRTSESISTATVPRVVGRKPTANGIIRTSAKEKLQKEVAEERKQKQTETQRKQEEQLKKQLEKQKLQFKLIKEEDTRFKLEQERIRELHERSNDTERDLRVSDVEDDEFNDPAETGEGRKRRQRLNLNGTSKHLQFDLARTGWGNGPQTLLVEDVEDEPEPRPPTFRKKDIVSNPTQFNLFDHHAVKAPDRTRESIASLVNHLKERAENQFQLVRMFYRWITFNVSFDVVGYYGHTRLPTDANEVLRNCKTTPEGYANLMEAMCRYAGIPAKVIHGLVKGYDYSVGDIVSLTENRIDHSWNVVYINGNWFFIDCAWGAGHVDAKRKWIRKFQEFYFIVDPDKMIVDHFPYMEDSTRVSAKWQLLASPVSANSFSQRLKMERAALEYDVKPVTHTQHHIINVKKEVEIQLQETGDILEDYSIEFRKIDGSKNLLQFVFACKINERTLKIILRPPQEIDYVLNVFAKRSLDIKGRPELLVTYVVKCTEVQFLLRQFPLNYRIYGAVPDYATYGFCSDITKCVEYTCSTGELVLPFKTKREVKCMTKLEHVENQTDLTTFCLISCKNKGISIKVRFPLEGYFKLTLFGKQADSDNFRPVATFLLDCNQVSHVHSGFPVAFEGALSLHCTLYKPLWKDLPANSQITVVLTCESAVKVKILFEELKQDDNHVFEGTITTPAAGQPFTIYGQIKEDGPLIGLYHFKIF